MKVALLAIMVLRSMETEIKVTVPKYEAEVLSVIYPEGSLRLLSKEPVGYMEVIDAASERERLRIKYGVNSKTSIPHVDDVFRRADDFVQAVEAARYVEPEADNSEEPAKKTRTKKSDAEDDQGNGADASEPAQQ